MCLTLVSVEDENFNQLGEEGSPEELKFSSALVDDLSKASGLPEASFEIESLNHSKIFATIIARVEITVNAKMKSVMEVIEDLKSQVGRENSALLTGSVTCHTRAIRIQEKIQPAGEEKNGPAKEVKPDLQLQVHEQATPAQNESMWQRCTRFLCCRSGREVDRVPDVEIGGVVDQDDKPTTTVLDPEIPSDKETKERTEKNRAGGLLLADISTGSHRTYTLDMCDQPETCLYSNKGVFFNIVNRNKKRDVRVLKFEGGAANGYGDVQAALYACKSGPCSGFENVAGKWYTVWNGVLRSKKSTTITLSFGGAVVKAGESVGFFLHAARGGGVCYSQEGVKAQDDTIVVEPWFATNSSKVFDKHSKKMYTIAGSVTYKLDAVLKPKNKSQKKEEAWVLWQPKTFVDDEVPLLTEYSREVFVHSLGDMSFLSDDSSTQQEKQKSFMKSPRRPNLRHAASTPRTGGDLSIDHPLHRVASTPQILGDLSIEASALGKSDLQRGLALTADVAVVQTGTLSMADVAEKMINRKIYSQAWVEWKLVVLSGKAERKHKNDSSRIQDAKTWELPADSQHHPSDAALLHHPSLRGVEKSRLVHSFASHASDHQRPDAEVEMGASKQDMPSPRDVPELQAVSANADEHSMEACPSFDVQTAPSDDIKAAPHAPRAAAVSDHPSLRKTNSLYLVPPMFKVSDETEPVTRSTGTDGPQPRRTQSYSGPRTVTSELTSANSFKV